MIKKCGGGEIARAAAVPRAPGGGARGRAGPHCHTRHRAAPPPAHADMYAPQPHTTPHTPHARDAAHSTRGTGPPSGDAPTRARHSHTGPARGPRRAGTGGERGARATDIGCGRAVLVHSTLRSGGRFRPLTTLEALTEQHVLRSASSSLEVTLSSGGPADALRCPEHRCPEHLLGD